MKYGLVLVAVAACSSPPRGKSPDAAIDVDGAVLDGKPDSVPDAPPDAQMFTPSCTTAPSVLYDASPRANAIIAAAGNTLYVSANRVEDFHSVDPAIVPIDLVSGVAGTPFIPGADAWLSAVPGAVIATEYRADGTIWRFDGGPTPTAVVMHRASPNAATEAGGYVYWGESDGMVRRQLVTGGPIEPLFTCGNNIRELIVVGADLFCADFLGNVMRGLATGPSTPVGISITDSYPIATMVGDGSTLYWVNLHPFPELYKLPVTSTTATIADKWASNGRYFGLALSGPTLYETSTQGLHKMDRTTFASQLIVPSLLIEGDPVPWNDQLYFTEEDFNVAGQRYVMHCVD